MNANGSQRKERTDSELNIATCHECGADTVAATNTAVVSICYDCIQDLAVEMGL